MRTEQIIDEYITSEPKEYIVGHCNNCGGAIHNTEDYIDIKDILYCDEECVEQYYEAEVKTTIVYCDECNDVIEDKYITDVFGNDFCDVDCLIKYYKNK